MLRSLNLSSLTLYNSPDDFRQVSFTYSGRRGGAVLSLPVEALREDTLSQGTFSEWILKHIDRWFASVRQLGLGIEQMEELILVTGCDRTRSWTNVAFLGSQHDAQVSFGVRIDGSDPNINVNFQFSPEHVRGAVLNKGPKGMVRQCAICRGQRRQDSFGMILFLVELTREPMHICPGVSCCPYPLDIPKQA